MEYDATLKSLLRDSARVALGKITGTKIENWLNVELPDQRSLRVDLLGETADQELAHLELQSTNDPDMPLRMAEYCLAIYRTYRRIPWQFCLYVGQAPLRMPGELRGARFQAAYSLIDVRDIDGEGLIDSPDLGDNLIAVLARLRDHRDAIHRIMARVGELPKGARETALGYLLTIAGLRRLVGLVQEEMKKMPVYIDLSENEVLGPPYKKGREEGREEGRNEGRQEGRKEGRKEGELNLLRRQIEKRFGTLPSWVEERLASKSTSELEELGVRLLDIASIDELLK